MTLICATTSVARMLLTRGSASQKVKGLAEPMTSFDRIILVTRVGNDLNVKSTDKIEPGGAVLFSPCRIAAQLL